MEDVDFREGQYSADGVNFNVKLIRHLHVLPKDRIPQKLVYFCADRKRTDGAIEYGILIEKSCLGNVSGDVCFFSENEQDALHLLNTLANGFTFPVSLTDIVNDLQADIS